MRRSSSPLVLVGLAFALFGFLVGGFFVVSGRDDGASGDSGGSTAKSVDPVAKREAHSPTIREANAEPVNRTATPSGKTVGQERS